MISVVTPFYNSEDYLRECIESVLAQTYSDLEYILLNNCSTDGSLEIAENLAKSDRRLRVINNSSFLSQVQNYNRAVSLVSSESKYFKIVQADDWIFPECISKMVDCAEQQPDTGVVSAYSILHDKVYLSGLEPHIQNLKGAEAQRLLILDGIDVFGNPNSVMYRTCDEALAGSFFEEDNPIEDTDATFRMLQNHSFGFVHQVLTFNRRNNESLMSSISTYMPLLAARLLLLHRYGPDCLDSDERRECTKTLHHEYFSYLGESTLRMREKPFWDYHNAVMRLAGIRFEGMNKLKYILVALADLALNPKSTFERLGLLYKKRSEP